MPKPTSRKSFSVSLRTHPLLWASVASGSMLALVVCYRIATQAVLIGSREGRWVYGYLQPFRPWSLVVCMAAGVACGLLLRADGSRLLRTDWQRIVAWMIVGLGVQAALRSLTPFSFERIFTSDGANSFYSVTTHYFASSVLADFDRMRTYFPLHAQSNMPGKLMLLYAMKYISREPDVLPWLVVVVSNLGAVLMYVFVRDLFGDRRTALLSSVLYLFVPAKLFFFPLMNTVTPVVVLACACLLMRWLTSGLGIYAWLLGMALYALVFFEPLPLVMGLLFLGLLVRTLFVQEVQPSRFMLHVLLVVLGLVSTYAAVYLILGFDVVETFRQIGADAIAFNVAAGRPYDIWIRENLREFLFGMGICQVVLVGAALVDGFWRRDIPEGRLSRAIVVLTLSLVGVLVATDYIGINRGEVTRLWIFLACFFQIPAAYVCARLDTRVALGVVLSTTLVQSALGTAMIGFILPG